MKQFISIFDQTINKFLSAFVVFLLTAMTLVVFAQVLFRFVHASIIWSEEISIYMMVWCTFLGAALCCRKGSMIGLEVIQALCTGRAKKAIVLFSALITVAFLGTLAVVGINIAAQMWMQSTPILKLPMGSIYAAIPTGAILMAINTGISAYELWVVTK